MIGIILPLLSAFSAASAIVLVRMGLDLSDYFSVSVVITLIGNFILWPLALIFTPLETVNLVPVFLFVIAGLLSPGLMRLLYYKGMDTVGVSVNASIFATYSLFSAIFAVLLLGEVLAFQNWIGIICVMFGVVFIERSVNTFKGIKKDISKRGLIFPILGALAISFSNITKKYGLIVYNEPLLGVAIGYLSSLVMYVLLLMFTNRNPGTQFRSMITVQNFKLFWKSGVLMSVNWILVFFALSFENVSLVTPLLQTEPLFVLLLTNLYLKDKEQISLRLFIASIPLLIGVILVSLN
jgi:drug/metabolite transporter (DMT)-like permease